MTPDYGLTGADWTALLRIYKFIEALSAEPDAIVSDETVVYGNELVDSLESLLRAEAAQSSKAAISESEATAEEAMNAASSELTPLDDGSLALASERARLEALVENHEKVKTSCETPASRGR